MQIDILGAGFLRGATPTDLVGISALTLMTTASGPALIAIPMAGGVISAFAPTAAAGAVAQYVDSWAIPASGLDRPGFACIPAGNGQTVLLPGLGRNTLFGLSSQDQMDASLFDATRRVTVSGVDAADVTRLEMSADGLTGFATLRTGGLATVQVQSDRLIAVSALQGPAGLLGAVATDLESQVWNGTTYTAASFAPANVLSLLVSTPQAGVLQRIDIVLADASHWIDAPAQLAMTEAGGVPYIVIAGTGSNSLSVLEIQSGPRLDGAGLSGAGLADTRLIVRDHVLDSLDTRFAHAAALETFTVAGHSLVVAAGSDDGFSVFLLLPGGRLHLLSTVEGSLAMPLHGVSALQALVSDGVIHLWVAQQADPYVSEYRIRLPDLGQSLQAQASGGQLLGGSHADVLCGGAASDSLFGGAGDDILLDGAGADSLSGGAGADSFLFSADGSTDTVLDFQPGLDRLDLSALPLGRNLGMLQDFQRPDGIELRLGDETLIILSANGGPLNLQDLGLNSGPYIDRVLQDASPVAVIRPLMQGLEQADTLCGSAQGEDIMGRGGDDLVDALAGNDVLWGGAGNDRLYGGLGNDRAGGEDGADVLWGGAGFDTLCGDAGNDVLDGGEGADLLEGGAGDDLLSGGAGFDNLYGGAGRDQLYGGDNPDRLFGEDGDDLVRAGSNFGTTVDGLSGGNGNDTLYGDAGFDLLLGDAGFDALYGGAQADNLYGGSENDTLWGDDGFDRLFCGTGDDLGYGGQGSDALFGDFGDDRLWGGSEADRMFGGAGNDLISGDAGDDNLNGGAGFDHLIGGAGDDTLSGGYNADSFVFAPGHGHDTITDFVAAGRADTLDVSQIAGFHDLSDVLAVARQQGDNVLITTGAASAILLLHVQISALGADDFIFATG
ncbi:calcium-binding protein [Cypionkella sinensis]|uniref:calcium-binding protein n=1 Tax=Cypionkella sinensis TaxID=1756043 RepID=UPI003636EBF1